MRTAQELNKSLQRILNHWVFCDIQSAEENDETVENFLKGIQLEAAKQGMTIAMNSYSIQAIRDTLTYEDLLK